MTTDLLISSRKRDTKHPNSRVICCKTNDQRSYGGSLLLYLTIKKYKTQLRLRKSDIENYYLLWSVYVETPFLRRNSNSTLLVLKNVANTSMSAISSSPVTTRKSNSRKNIPNPKYNSAYARLQNQWVSKQGDTLCRYKIVVPLRRLLDIVP